MRFRVAPEVFERFPDVYIAVVAATGVVNGSSLPTATAEVRGAETEVRARLTAGDLVAHPFIARWREAFKTVGSPPSKYKSSVEALLGRVLKGDSLPDLSPVVDLANAVSLRAFVPVGAHDVDKLSGDLMVKVATGDEVFYPVGGERELVPAGEIVYADDEAVRTRRWVWRQGEGARVSGESTTVLFPIDGWRGFNDADVEEAAWTLAHLLQAHTGARTALSFLHRNNPEAVVFTNGEPTGEKPGEARERAGQAPSEAKATTSPPPAVHGAEKTPDAIDDLLTRGVVDVVVRENLERRLRRGERLRVKLGIDPTGPRLHIGRAVALRKLRQFQDLGHTVCLVIGDFTAQIGDMSDKDSERRVLTEMDIYQNMANYKTQIGTILDERRVEWSYNSDWLGQLRLKEVIQLSRLFTVAQMIERENFSQRFAAGKPISLQEFLYPLMQGFDSYALNADVEIGGTDQLFNLMAGRTVQQRGFARPPQDLITMAMIWGLDGRKMSTSEGNTILIDEPAVDMYGKVMKVGDEHIVPYFEATTVVPMVEVRAIAAALADGLNPITAKKKLAYAITTLYHGDAGALEGQRYFEDLHQKQGELADADWPETTIAGAAPRLVGQLFKDAGLVKSTSEARRIMEQGGLEIDGERVADFSLTVTPINGMKLKRGKNGLARLRLGAS